MMGNWYIAFNALLRNKLVFRMAKIRNYKTGIKPIFRKHMRNMEDEQSRLERKDLEEKWIVNNDIE